MAFEHTVEAGRTQDVTVTIKTASGGYAQIAATDEVRCKVGTGTGTPDLDLTSEAATANGSRVTIAQRGDGSAVHCSVTVRLACTLAGSTQRFSTRVLMCCM